MDFFDSFNHSGQNPDFNQAFHPGPDVRNNFPLDYSAPFTLYQHNGYVDVYSPASSSVSPSLSPQNHTNYLPPPFQVHYRDRSWWSTSLEPSHPLSPLAHNSYIQPAAPSFFPSLSSSGHGSAYYTLNQPALSNDHDNQGRLPQQQTQQVQLDATFVSVAPLDCDIANDDYFGYGNPPPALLVPSGSSPVLGHATAGGVVNTPLDEYYTNYGICPPSIPQGTAASSSYSVSKPVMEYFEEASNVIVKPVDVPETKGKDNRTSLSKKGQSVTAILSPKPAVEKKTRSSTSKKSISSSSGSSTSTFPSTPSSNPQLRASIRRRRRPVYPPPCIINPDPKSTLSRFKRICRWKTCRHELNSTPEAIAHFTDVHAIGVKGQSSQGLVWCEFDHAAANEHLMKHGRMAKGERGVAKHEYTESHGGCVYHKDHPRRMQMKGRGLLDHVVAGSGVSLTWCPICEMEGSWRRDCEHRKCFDDLRRVGVLVGVEQEEEATDAAGLDGNGGGHKRKGKGKRKAKEKKIWKEKSVIPLEGYVLVRRRGMNDDVVVLRFGVWAGESTPTFAFPNGLHPLGGMAFEVGPFTPLPVPVQVYPHIGSPNTRVFADEDEDD